MNLTLKRKDFVLYGIFGELFDEKDERVAVTLEHSYNKLPKLFPGKYLCKRGFHTLASHPNFETFEVMGVPGHDGILFHRGNVNNDSDGCILLGTNFGTCCILDSREAFDNFMKMQEGLDEFYLTVL